MNSNYRPDIDGLRAIAVLSVIGFHAFPNWASGGFVGVDIFFVISGFLISGIVVEQLRKGQFYFRDFYTRRIRRIFPALILVVAACAVIGWYVLSPSEYKQLGKHIAAGAGFASNLVLWQEAGYFDNPNSAKPLLHLWSLGVEEQFYIIWPILLYWAWRRRYSLMAISVSIVFISFLLNILVVEKSASASFYWPVTRFWELLLGGALSLIAMRHGDVENSNHTRLKAKPYFEVIKNACSILGILFMASAIFYLDKNTIFPGWWALVPTIGACLVISAGSSTWINRVVLSNRMMVWIGGISYPLYLWHWPLLSFATIIANTASLSREIRVAAVALAFALAWLTCRFFEKPIRYGGFGRNKAVALCIFMAIIAGAGICINRDGVPFRYPQKLIDLIESHRPIEYQKAQRFHRCSLAPDEGSEVFLNCVDKGDGPLVFLWGDSHAAALYPGLKQYQSVKGFRVAQYTASACPPLVGLEFKSAPYCRSINDENLERIRQLKPEMVLLHAYWNTNYDLSTLDKTIHQIRDLGVKKIVLLGPVPEWKKSIQRSVFSYYLAFGTMPPKRMRFNVDERVAVVDMQMSVVAKKLGIQYISALNVLCNQEGCLTRLEDDGVELTAIDYSHLSLAGANFMVSEIADSLFEAPP